MLHVFFAACAMRGWLTKEIKTARAEDPRTSDVARADSAARRCARVLGQRHQNSQGEGPQNLRLDREEELRTSGAAGADCAARRCLRKEVKTARAENPRTSDAARADSAARRCAKVVRGVL